MKIILNEIPISDVVKGYIDKDEEGVVAYGGILDVRPPYQREFIYKDKQRNEVINTINKNFPLNVMYWVKNSDTNFEVLDGQQRLISICQYYQGDFAINYKYYHNLTPDEQKQFLDYKLMVYFCEGTDTEKLAWFDIINIAGEKLTPQELRNAVYTGTWLSDAKHYFSKTNCVAYNLGKDYMDGVCIRQDYLETVLNWISQSENIIEIKDYMAQHQHDENASILWQYFQSVINWVKIVYPNYRKEMKGVEWGYLYNKFKNERVNAENLEKEVSRLMLDDDVTKKSGIYEYLFDKQEKHLSIRAFTEKMKREAYERQQGICADCGDYFDIGDMEADHITPWHEGGRTIASNCQMLCKACNRRKSGI